MAGRILLVDDEAGILLTLKAILEVNGYQVETASSAADALRKLEQSAFHLVITDMKMETDDAGFMVAAAAKRRPSKPAVAILSGYRALARDWQARGADAFFEKPTNTEELLRHVDLLVNGFRDSSGVWAG